MESKTKNCFSVPVQRVFKTHSPVSFFSWNYGYSEMELQCTFKGWPRPRVAWYNPDRKLIINGSESFYLYEQLVGQDTLSSVLRNRYIQEKNEGDYKCIGMNNITGWSTNKSLSIYVNYHCK